MEASEISVVDKQPLEVKIIEKYLSLIKCPFCQGTVWEEKENGKFECGDCGFSLSIEKLRMNCGTNLEKGKTVHQVLQQSIEKEKKKYLGKIEREIVRLNLRLVELIKIRSLYKAIL